MITEPDAIQLVACFRYQDARAAMAWLKSAFGFVEKLVVEGEGDTITHAELTLGPTMIMLGSERNDGFDLKSPASLGGNSQSVYMIVGDDQMVDDIFSRASAVGAEIVQAPENPEYGGRTFTVRDLEGNLWSFGSYNPWAG
jgi:uncharacterized glyoxalase superfamily protein PhnB